MYDVFGKDDDFDEIKKNLMINKDIACLKSLVKIVEAFGFDYVKKHKDNFWLCYSENNHIGEVSFMFESEKDRPDLIPDHLGWTVYATVKVNLLSGEAIIIDGVLPDGTRIIKKN